jgi:cytoskeletal protein CcmA (bactofilin family)
MFQTKKTDGPLNPAFPPPGPSPMATNAKPFAEHAVAGEAGCSIINEWLTMRGDLESEGDLLVKGKVHGNIICKLLVVDIGAVIKGTIKAHEVVIRGATRGLIQAHRVRIEKTARVESEIYQDTIAIEEGARFKGALAALEEYVSGNVPGAIPEPIERAVTASLYQLLDQARSTRAQR